MTFPRSESDRNGSWGLETVVQSENVQPDFVTLYSHLLIHACTLPLPSQHINNTFTRCLEHYAYLCKHNRICKVFHNKTSAPND